MLKKKEPQLFIERDNSCHKNSFFFNGIFSLFILLLFASYSSSQENTLIDSLKNEYNLHPKDTIGAAALSELCWQYAYINFDSAIFFGEKGLWLSEDLNFFNGESIANSNLANAYSINAQYTASLHYYQKSLEIDQSIGNKEFIAKDKVNIAVVRQKMGDYGIAVELFFECLKYYEKNSDSLHLLVIYHNLGNTFGYQNDTERAKKYYTKAFDISKALGYKQYMARNLDGLGICAVYTHDTIKATTYFNRALSIFEEIDFDYGKSNIYANKGFMFEEFQQLDSAILYYNKGLALNKKLGDIQGEMISLFNLGKIHTALGDFETAEIELLEALKLSLASKSKREIVTIYQGLSELFERRNDYKSAYSYYLTYALWKDSLFNEEKQQIIEEQDAIYRASQREQKIELLKKETEIAKNIATHRKTLLLGAGVVVVLVLIIIFFYAKQKKSDSDKKIIELEQMALRAQMNPHFIFNSLNSIQRLFVEGKMNKATDYMADFSHLVRSILDNSSKSKITLKEELKGLSLYCEMEKLRTDSQIDYVFNIESSIDQDLILVPPMIIQPFVENAIWHGILPSKKKGVVTVTVKNESNIICTITDNGIGMKAKGKDHEPKGINISERRLGQKVKIEELSPGTKITLILSK
jgi:tetratricopeptide (TPR) repeat protein